MTAADQHKLHIAHLAANAGKTDANYRKTGRQLRLRNWLLQGRPTDQFMLTRTGMASGHGMSLYLMDDAETDRPTTLIIDSVEDAYAIIELAARFINDRDALNDPEVKGFHYQSLEVDRLDTGETSSIHVRFDNRDENFHSYPSTSRHMSLPYSVFKVIRAVMSRMA